MNGWVLPEDVLRGAPTHTPRVFELADLELLLSGAYAPLAGFMRGADVTSVTARGRLADGTPWPVPVTLEVPHAVAAALDTADPLRRALVLTDRDGMPVAAVEAREVWRVREGAHAVGGPVRRLGEPRHGSFRRLRRTPADVRRMLPPGRVLGIFADRPLHRPQLAQLALAARTLAGSVLVLVPVGTPGPDGMPPATIVAVPIVRRGDEIRDALLRARVATAYGVTHLLSTGDSPVSGGGLRVLVPRELAYDTRDGQWRSKDDIPPRNRRAALTPAEITEMLDRGVPLPEWHTPPAVAREIARVVPPRRQRGLVVYFTGLPAAGKSTIARGVADALLESGERTVTLLDGDVLRRALVAGPDSGTADRDGDARRIGWVAAEIARHGGLVLCCPVAPYPAARGDARALARAAGGGFILVHLDTPLEVCEQRDQKGLYARARAGEVAGVSGVDIPYEPPTDADLAIDTSQVGVGEAVEAVLAQLASGGWIEARRQPPAGPED